MLRRSQGSVLSVPDQEEHVDAVGGFEVIALPGLRALADTWQSHRKGDDLPSRRDLDPSEFPALLPHIYILDREPAPVYWRYRLAGDEIHQSLQRISMRGCGLDEIMPPSVLPTVVRRWSAITEKAVGIYMDGAIYREKERYRNGSRLLLPLSESRDRQVTGLLGVSVLALHSAALPDSTSIRIHHIRL